MIAAYSYTCLSEMTSVFVSRQTTKLTFIFLNLGSRENETENIFLNK
jgi:hypothetical protein